MDYEVRKATLDDREAITELIAESARRLSREHYADTQIEAAIESVFGVDSSLIEDETYFVAEQNGTLIGCGGWSSRKTARRLPPAHRRPLRCLRRRPRGSLLRPKHRFQFHQVRRLCVD